MSNPMLKMFLPMGVKMLQNPSLKPKLLDLFASQKAKYIENDNEDIKIELSSNSEDILVKVYTYNKYNGEFISLIAVYSYEELVELLSKIKI
jgi:hypothetical protein